MKLVWENERSIRIDEWFIIGDRFSFVKAQDKYNLMSGPLRQRFFFEPHPPTPTTPGDFRNPVYILQFYLCSAFILLSKNVLYELIIS